MMSVTLPKRKKRVNTFEAPTSLPLHSGHWMVNWFTMVFKSSNIRSKSIAEGVSQFGRQ